MKRNKALIMIVIILVVASISLFGLVACDDKEGGGNDNGSNGRGMRFESGLDVDGLIDLVCDGTIKNYTLKSIEKEDEAETLTYTFYVADELYYMYYTSNSDGFTSFGGYIIDGNFAYEIFPDSGAYTIKKYKVGSDAYDSIKRVLTFDRESGISNILSHYSNFGIEEGEEIKNFKADNDCISWSIGQSVLSNPNGEYIVSYVTLYNVNSTEICEFPDEVKNYKEIAVEQVEE